MCAHRFAAGARHHDIHIAADAQFIDPQRKFTIGGRLDSRIVLQKHIAGNICTVRLADECKAVIAAAGAEPLCTVQYITLTVSGRIYRRFQLIRGFICFIQADNIITLGIFCIVDTAVAVWLIAIAGDGDAGLTNGELVKKDDAIVRGCLCAVVPLYLCSGNGLTRAVDD